VIDLNQRTSYESSQTARGRQWRFPDGQQISPDLLSAVDNNEFIAHLLHRRGITSGPAAKGFLNAEHYTPTSPMELPHVTKAIVRIIQAIELKEHITVYGDYDVDGITGTSVLLTVLRKLGADVDFYIPNRADEGYGLNLKAVSILASKRRTKLIVTCDCGVSNFAEINFAKSLGVDSIVLDHHSMPDMMPPAVAIVHPKRLPEDHPLFHLPGVGVAYKVCEALLTDRGFASTVPDLLDFVTLGMIADLVPLVRENRYLVQIGLPQLLQTKRPGLEALIGQVRRSEDTDMVGFGIAPRINAVGRLADAKVAVELLTTEDPNVAAELARQLQNENQKRQEICERIFTEATQLITSELDLKKDKAIAIYKSDWHHGVVGIVASRLVERYGVPVFIAERHDSDGSIRGSARSIDGIDLYEVLKANEVLLSKWGGHKMAAGFSTTLDKADTLCRALVDTCNRLLPGEVLKPPIDIDAVLATAEVDIPLTKSLNLLGPYGMANKKPIFCMRNLLCQNVRVLGKEGKHVRVTLVDETTQSIFEGLIWNYRGHAPEIGTFGDVVFNLEINVFNNRERLQLHVIDWRGFGAASMPSEGEIDRANSLPGVAVIKEEIGTVVEIDNGQIDVATLPTSNVEPLTQRSRLRTLSSQRTWRDLREHNGSVVVLQKAIEKFPNTLAIFAEPGGQPGNIAVCDRTAVTNKEHLLIWQYPPSLKVLQEVLAHANPNTVYICGGAPKETYDVSNFLKKLVGLIRFTVSKKDGQVHANKLAAALGTTPISAALGMALLQKVGSIDWYVEDGLLFIDLLGPPNACLEDFSEYRQLDQSLKQIEEFRDWCATAKLKEIQLAAMPNQIGLQEESAEPTTAVSEPVAISDPWQSQGALKNLGGI
jgi:single-stranded-DNA-specific exonuclease RecJ